MGLVFSSFGSLLYVMFKPGFGHRYRRALLGSICPAEELRYALSSSSLYFPLSRWWQKSKSRLHSDGLANVRPSCLDHCDEQSGDGSHGDDRTAPPAWYVSSSSFKQVFAKTLFQLS